MSHEASDRFTLSPADAGRQVAQLRHVLKLVEQIAGRSEAPERPEFALDQNARISSAYSAADPIVQRRFDAFAGETAAWSAAGVQALVAAQDDPTPPRAAAGRLADELSAALRRLSRLLPY